VTVTSRSFRKPAPRLTHARVGLCHCQRGLQGRAFRAGDQDAQGQLAFLCLDAPGPPKRPSAQGNVLCLRPPVPARRCQSVECRGFPLLTESGPAAETVLHGRWRAGLPRGWTSRYARSRASASGRRGARGAKQLTALRRSCLNVSAPGRRSGWCLLGAQSVRLARRPRWWKARVNREATLSPSANPEAPSLACSLTYADSRRPRQRQRQSDEVKAGPATPPGNPGLCLGNRPRILMSRSPQGHTFDAP